MFVLQFTQALSGTSVPRSISGRAWISTSAPVMVAKFMTSDMTGNGEPAMSIVQPVSQYLDHYTFTVSTWNIRYLNGT